MTLALQKQQTSVKELRSQRLQQCYNFATFLSIPFYSWSENGLILSQNMQLCYKTKTVCIINNTVSKLFC
jgi:hypothetical protein